MNSQSNPVDNLAELESVNIPFQEDGFPSVITDKAEAVKGKEELLMEQLKEKEEEVKRLKECLQVQRKELEEELIEKMKQLEQERELRKELESMFQQSLVNIDKIQVQIFNIMHYLQNITKSTFTEITRNTKRKRLNNSILYCLSKL